MDCRAEGRPCERIRTRMRVRAAVRASAAAGQASRRHLEVAAAAAVAGSRARVPGRIRPLAARDRQAGGNEPRGGATAASSHRSRPRDGRCRYAPPHDHQHDRALANRWRWAADENRAGSAKAPRWRLAPLDGAAAGRGLARGRRHRCVPDRRCGVRDQRPFTTLSSSESSIPNLFAARRIFLRAPSFAAVLSKSV